MTTQSVSQFVLTYVHSSFFVLLQAYYNWHEIDKIIFFITDVARELKYMQSFSPQAYRTAFLWFHRFTT